MKKFLAVLSAIGMGLAYIFYVLLNSEKRKGFKSQVNFAEKEAEAQARERNEKVKDDSVAMSNDIADMLDK